MDNMDNHNNLTAATLNIQNQIYPQNFDLYRQLVHDYLTLSSKNDMSSYPLMNGGHSSLDGAIQHGPYSIGFEFRSSVNNDSILSHNNASSLNRSGDNSQYSDYLSELQNFEPWSPALSEADSQLSSTGPPSSIDLSEGTNPPFNYFRVINDKTKEERRIARRRERNRTSQRAFRARKEKYTQDLERHYMELRQRYDTLVGVIQTMTGYEHESFMQQDQVEAKGILIQKEISS